MLVTDSQIDIFHHSEALRNNHAGAYSCFEGWIRDHNDGHEVEKLEYEVFEPIAIKEGMKLWSFMKYWVRTVFIEKAFFRLVIALYGSV